MAKAIHEHKMLWVLLALVLMVLSARVRATQWGRGAPKVLLKSDGVGVSRGLKPTALPYHYESSPTYKGNFGEIRPMGELCRRRPNMERLRLAASRGQRWNRQLLSNFTASFFSASYISSSARIWNLKSVQLQMQ